MKLKYRVIERFRGKYSIEAMCEVFEVSRSGYYAWRNRQQKEAKDQWLVDLVVACQRQSKQTYGIRRVRRWIQRQTGKLVNVKAILRVMRKLNLLSGVRRRRPYPVISRPFTSIPICWIGTSIRLSPISSG